MLSSVAKDVVLPQGSTGVLVTAGGVAASTVEMLSLGGGGGGGGGGSGRGGKVCLACWHAISTVALNVLCGQGGAACKNFTPLLLHCIQLLLEVER